MKQHDNRLGFRSDIEGLRAVAILVVVAAHAKVTWLAGGFVGVDVFFVLSGYLITGLLVREIQATGTLRFASFYVRRFRRLLPALLVMLGCSGVLGFLLIVPGEQPEQAMGAATAALWLSNFHFAFLNLGYFSPDAESNLFLHTWSLGVEEQFYLVWPLLVVLAFAGETRRSGRGTVKIAMLGVFSVSLLVCVSWTQGQPQLAFYMMPARAWQFALGALIFLCFGAPAAESDLEAPGQGYRPAMQRTVGLAGWAGLALIVLSAVMLNPGVPYPGIWALLPSVGAGAVLAAGARSPLTGVGRALSVRPMQAIGRVSYSWYLWHWPVLLLGATVADTDNMAIRLGLAALSFVLAAFSYFLVEAPIRHEVRLLVRPRRTVFAAVILMVLANVLAIRWHNAQLGRMFEPDQIRYVTAGHDGPIIYDMGCADWYKTSDVRFCEFGQDDALHTVVALGDSVALQWFPAFQEVFNKPDWRLLVSTKSSCPMVNEPYFYAHIHREYTECAEWRREALREIVKLRPDIVILGSAFGYDFTEDQWKDGTIGVLKSISDATGNIFIMRATPVLPVPGPTCLPPRSWLYKALSSNSACAAAAFDSRSDNIYLWLESAAAQFNNVSVVDMTESICPNGQCHAELDGVIVFRDKQHLTATYAKSLAPVLGERLKISDHP